MQTLAMKIPAFREPHARGLEVSAESARAPQVILVMTAEPK